jgi:hypothetical protein
MKVKAIDPKTPAHGSQVISKKTLQGDTSKYHTKFLVKLDQLIAVKGKISTIICDQFYYEEQCTKSGTNKEYYYHIPELMV